MRVGVLGPLEVVAADGTPVPVGGLKERALLAILAVHANHVVSEKLLIDALWGDDPPRTARRTLQSYLSRVRKALAEASPSEEVPLRARGGGWSLQLSPEMLDIADVEATVTRARLASAEGDFIGAALALSDALRTWRGRPLDEFADQTWAITEAARLDEYRQLIVDERLEAELACGRHAEVIGELEAQCRAHPLREHLWRLRMIALYRSGRHAEALRVFQELRSTLADELGIVPSPELCRLEQAVLMHDPSLEWEPPPAPTAATTTASPAPAAPAARPLPAALDRLREPAFVGRDVELSQLHNAWSIARSGQREVVLLAGEPGIGKTTLAARVADEAAEDNGVVLFGRCDEESVVAFQPWVESLDHLVETTDADDLRALLGPQAPDLALLLPSLGRRLPEVADVAGSGLETERYRMFEAVATLLRAVAAVAPVLLVFDDLHWADRPTLQLLQHVIRRGGDDSMLIVGTYRDTDLARTHPMAEALSDLRRTGLVTRVPVRGLSAGDVEDFVAGGNEATTVDAEFAEALWQETEGSPLFLREILRHLHETGAVDHVNGRWVPTRRIDQLGIPEGVKDAIGRRLTRLSDSANTALRVGSVIGRELRLDVLEAVTGLSTDELLDALDEAAAAGVVDERSDVVGRWTFTHALVRQALYDELSLTRRVRLHQRVGEALEAIHGEDAGPHLAELAYHFSQSAVGGTADQAIDYARRAGEHANTLAAWEEAGRHFAMGVEVAEDADAPVGVRADLLLSQGAAEWRAADMRRARATFERVVAMVPDSDYPRLGAAALGYAGAGVRPLWVEIGKANPRAVGLLEDALAACPDGDSVLRARLLACLAQELYFVRGTVDRRETLSAEALAMARRLGDPPALAFVLSARNLAVFGPGRAAELEQNASEMLELALALGDRQIEAHARRNRYVVRCDLGDREGQAADLEAWSALIDELKDPVAAGFRAAFVGATMVVEGRLEEGERCLLDGFADLQKLGDPNCFGVFALNLFVIRLLQGRLAEIINIAMAAVPVYPSLADVIATGSSFAYAEIGLVDEARAALAGVDLAGPDALPRNIFWLMAVGAAGMACLHLGDPALAATVYDLLLPHQDRTQAIGMAGYGSLHYPLAIAAAAMGRDDVARAHFEAAIEANRDAGMPPFVVLVQTRYAGWLADVDKGPDGTKRALALVEEAIVEGETLGLDAYVREARGLRSRLLGQGVEVVVASRVGPSRLDKVRAKMTAVGRAAVAYWTRGASDEELYRRFSSERTQWAMFNAMAKSFQPVMAFGFNGVLVFELLPPDDAFVASDWWSIEIADRKATAQRGRVAPSAATVHARLSDFIRLASGELHPVVAMAEGLVDVDGDFLIAARLLDMFGVVEPL